MILNVSWRTDIVAFYTEWFMNRYKEGYVDVRNPFYKKLVSRIYFDDVDLLVFCTKNPSPIIPYIEKIKKPIIFNITITPYHKDIEPNVPNKNDVINEVKKLSKILGKERIYIRYDPILLNKKYTVNYHIKAFSKLTKLLEGYIETIIISFVDEYKNVREHQQELNLIPLENLDYEVIGKNFSTIAKKHNMTVQTCYENRNLVEYGFKDSPCISSELAYQITGKKYKKWKARKCNCVEMVDIGQYNACFHLCKYCYANFDEKEINNNINHHDKNSSLIIGKIKPTDIIKRRK